MGFHTPITCFLCLCLFLYASVFEDAKLICGFFIAFFWNFRFRWELLFWQSPLHPWPDDNLEFKAAKILFCHFQKNNLHLHCATDQRIQTIHFIVSRDTLAYSQHETHKVRNKFWHYSIHRIINSQNPKLNTRLYFLKKHIFSVSSLSVYWEFLFGEVKSLNSLWVLNIFLGGTWNSWCSQFVACSLRCCLTLATSVILLVVVTLVRIG